MGKSRVKSALVKTKGGRATLRYSSEK